MKSFHCAAVRGMVLLGGLAGGASTQAGLIPTPRAYYDFEYFIGGEVFQNKVAPGQFDGYLGTSPSDTVRNPQIVPGLLGSSQALKFTSDSIAQIPTLVTDTNGDRLDEDVFAGAFTVFARVEPTNVAQLHVANADRGPLSTSVRGWYMDFSNSTQNANGEYLLRPRFTTGGGPVLHPNGTETTNYKNIDSYAVVWIPDPTPGGSPDGRMQIYINGLLFAEQAHSSASVYVGEAGFNIGFDNLVSWGQGIVIDDLAIWDTALNAEQILLVHEGALVPEPEARLLLGLGLAGIGLWAAARGKKKPFCCGMNYRSF